MDRRNIGGKKKKRGAKFSQERAKREMLWKGPDEEYGVVEKMYGDMRCGVLCSDKTSRICHIRGRFKRRVWINVGDIVLVSVRAFETDKGDIIHKYNPQEVETLKLMGEMGFHQGDTEISFEDIVEDEVEEETIDLFKL